MLESYDSITSKTHRRDPAPWILNSHTRLLRALRHGLSPVLSPLSRSNRGRRDQGLPPAPVAHQEAGRQFHHRCIQCPPFFLWAGPPPPTKTHRLGPPENEE